MCPETKDFKLIVTSALREELPVQYLRQQGVPVVSLKAALSSDTRELKTAKKGILFLITGPGKDNSLKAANWIRKNLRPLFVLNIGGAAIVDESLPLGQWYIPERVFSGEAHYILIAPGLPIPYKTRFNKIPLLYSSIKPVKDPAGLPRPCLIDMEAYWQAREFQGTGVSFHCIKFATDRADPHASTHYRASLEGLRSAVEKLFQFLDQPRPSFSVIIPTKNRAERLKMAIESVLEQEYPPEKIIVVDDGSRDHTRRILDRYKNSVTALFLKDCYGVSRARMVGTLLARTEWLAFLDSDDLWQKDKLQRQAEFIMKYPFFEILQSEEIWIRKGKRVNPCKHHQKPEGWAWPEVLYRCLISPSGVALKKDLLLRFGGFREDFPVCEDFDLWARITRHKPVGLVREPGVVKFGGHEDQLSRSFPAMDRFRLKTLLELYFKEDEPLFKAHLKEAIKTKAEILLKGAMKRGLTFETEYYRRVLEMVRT